MDAYRLEGAADAVDLDLDRMLEDGALLIEWADRIKNALPPPRYGSTCAGWQMNNRVCFLQLTTIAANIDGSV
jgi:tRNA A37 threonylcarbamoyladenosine biosynthesis protein TsaE